MTSKAILGAVGLALSLLCFIYIFETAWRRAQELPKLKWPLLLAALTLFLILGLATGTYLNLFH